MGKAVFVASGKGGVGKTSLTAGVSACLAAMGFSVLCIDADAGLGNLDIVLGLTDRTALDLGDILRGDAALKDAACEHDEIKGLFLLGAPQSEERFDPAAFPALMTYAASRYDYCIVDCPSGLGAITRAAVPSANMGIIVTTPDRTALRDAERAARLCEKLTRSGCEVRLAVNRVRVGLMASGNAPNADDAMDTVGLPLLGVVPEDERVIASSNRSEPLVLRRPDGASAAYLRIARRLAGERVPISGIK